MYSDEDILDAIFEDITPYGNVLYERSFYGSRNDLPEAELYVTDGNGDCWRVRVERHGHH